jgi:molecular chaperone DnaJ
MATTERDYYVILGVERNASDAEIKRAYRKLAQQWHPDVNADPAAHDRFTEINEAYQVLSDPDRRGRYDMFGHAGLGGSGGAGFEGFGGFSDIFDAFFGGSAGAASARRGRPQPGADLRYDLRITFEEAVKGTDKQIEFSVLQRCETCSGSGAAPGTEAIVCTQCNGRGEVRSVRQTMLGQMVNVTACPRCRGEGRVVELPCDTCRGDGRTERHRTLQVSIPAGIDEGHQIRLSNEGEVGPRGGPAGSLYVAVHVQPHPSLKRDGTELYYEAAISIAQAALGTRITVPTVDGSEEIEIKPGTQPATEIRLRGKGVPHLRRSGARGDLHVLVDVVVPTRLSRKGRELLAAYADEAGESIATGGAGGLREKLGLG